MSTAVFPTLSGLSFDITRSPDWGGNPAPVEAVSGKRTAVALWTYPRWRWELKYNYLRSDLAELETLIGFINARRGMFDTFLYNEPDDNAVTGQTIAVGDGTSAIFQLQRSYGGFIEPVFAPHTVSKIYLNGVNQTTGWSVAGWGTATPGLLTFTTPPGSGVSITADFSFYFPCRFDNAAIVFTKILYNVHKADSLTFSSEK